MSGALQSAATHRARRPVLSCHRHQQPPLNCKVACAYSLALEVFSQRAESGHHLLAPLEGPKDLLEPPDARWGRGGGHEQLGCIRCLPTAPAGLCVRIGCSHQWMIGGLVGTEQGLGLRLPLL